MKKTHSGMDGTEKNTCERILVNTTTLMQMIDCGRKAATEIGMAAGARITVGRRVLWNVKLIQQYLDAASM